jgi:hypothetical protein
LILAGKFTKMRGPKLWASGITIYARLEP